MAELLFKLRNVPDDEAEEVRELLQQHHIDFYETSAGSWSISLPAIWLHDKEKLAEGKRLIEAYQCERTKRVQQDYQEQCKAGTQRTLFDLVAEAPLKFLLYLAGILFMLYLSSIPVSFLFRS